MCSLLAQDLSELNAAELTPLTPEVISRQATINIGEAEALQGTLALLGVPPARRRPSCRHAQPPFWLQVR